METGVPLAPVPQPSGATPFPASRIAGFGIPLVLGMGGHALFNLADLWVVGSLGKAALAAVTIASLVNAVAMVILQGVSDGTVAVMARRIGAGNREGAAKAARQGFWLAAGLGVLLGVPPWWYARELAALFGAEGEALAAGTACLEVMSLGSVTMFLLMQAGATLRAQGSGRAPAVLLLGANLLNLPLSLALVNGWAGLPEMGVVGACWGTVLARGVFAGIGLRLAGTSGLHLRFAGPGPDAGEMGRLLRLGLPVAGQWLVRVVPLLAVLEVVGRIGTGASAAYGIASRLDQLALFATAGWGAAAATAVGQGLGAGDPRGAARALWRAVLLASLTMLAAGVAWFLLAERLIPLVGREEGAPPGVVAFGAGYLRVVVLGYPALGAALVLSMGISGAGSVKTPLLVDGLVLVGIQVPLVFLLAPGEGGGSVEGVWWAVAGSWWLLAGVYLAVVGSGRWERSRVE